MNMVNNATTVSKKVAVESIRAVAETEISLQGWQEGVMTEILYRSGQCPPYECAARAREKLLDCAGRECDLIASSLATYSLRLEDVMPEIGGLQQGRQGNEKRVRFADAPVVASTAPEEDSMLDIEAVLGTMAPAWRDSISNVIDKPFR